MPQARTAGSSTNKPSGKKSPAAKPAATRSTAAKAPAARSTAASSAAKAAAAKPAAAKSTAKRPARAAAKPAAAKSAAAKTTGARASSRSAATKPAAARSAAATKGGAAKGTAGSKPRVTINVNSEGLQIEVVADRLRKLNEKIIDFGREAGESTLTSYEKALKTIASGISQSPAKDELEWITHLAASQAKFVREITDSWAKAARERRK